MRRTCVVNDRRRISAETAEGYALAWPHLVTVTDKGHVSRTKPKDRGKVALAIGNGTGHEPAMVGLVGQGLFDVNILGELFAAPSAPHLVHGLRAADRGAGVLLCVSNHAGDVMNAELALESLTDDDPHVEMVVLYDDIAGAGPDGAGERRGGPGLLITWKTVGAAAEAGYDIAGCRAIAERTRDRTRTLTAILDGTVHPVSGQELSVVPEGCVQIGVGVHGEVSGELVPLTTADDVVARMLDTVLDELGPRPGDRVIAHVNDAGAMAVAELAIIHRCVAHQLADRGLVLARSWFGRYATTWTMAGFGLSVCVVDDELARLYDAPCHAPALASQGSGPVG